MRSRFIGVKTTNKMLINPKTLDINTLPYVPLESRSCLPNKPSIYFAVDGENTIQYIGKSFNLRTRWANHSKIKELNSIGNIRIFYLILYTELIEITESSLIEYFKPPLNRLGKADGTSLKLQNAINSKVGNIPSLETLRKWRSEYKNKNNSL